MEVKMRYCDMQLRQSDGSIRRRRVPTYTVPDEYYDKAGAAWLAEHDPAGYIEYMHEVDEAFIAECFGG